LVRCIESWKKNGFNVISLNRDNEAYHVRTNFNLDPVIFKDNHDTLCLDRFGPSFQNIFLNRDLSKPMCIVNADVYLCWDHGLSAQLEELCHSYFLFAHRIDYSAPSYSSPTIYKKGVDFVAFRPDRILKL